MGNRRKDLFSQLDGLLGDAIELECANEKKGSKPKYGGSTSSSSRNTSTSSNTTSSIKNRIAMFENNDDRGNFSRRPSVASSKSSTRTIRTSPIQTIELTQPSASTLMKTRSRLTPYNSNNEDMNSYNTKETNSDTIEDFLDSFNSSSNSDTENDEESTHTADTSIFSESPPPKSTTTKSPTTPLQTSQMSHKQFQNIIRIGTSTVDHLSGMLECMEAMVLSENDFIENELSNFTNAIQESAAHNTYIIKVFQDELESQAEERDRMVSVLQLVPSFNDNLDLINQLEKMLRVMKYFEEDFTREINSGISKEDYDRVLSLFDKIYNSYIDITSDLQKDIYIDVSEYQFTKSGNLPKPPHLQHEKDLENNNAASSPAGGKVVRFKDNLIEDDPDDLAARQQLMSGGTKFKPYTDVEDSETSSIASSFDTQTNQQIFAQHQQQLLDQEDDLGFLLDSVRRQHSMGLGINQEIDEHIILLNDLENGVDRAYTRLSQALNRLKTFQKLCKENGSMVTIILLTIILIVLLIVLN